jgi:hypothetical protein
MDRDSDILFLFLTSHGSPDGLAITAGRRADTLKPSTLVEMLDQTGVQHKVVIISACYSGVFIPRLANADTLVITAADADHASFGCEDKEWTYFGDAFFNIALRQSKTLKDAFLLARTLVSKRELRQGFDTSHPQMAGGDNGAPARRPPLMHPDPSRSQSPRASVGYWAQVDGGHKPKTYAHIPLPNAKQKTVSAG